MFYVYMCVHEHMCVNVKNILLFPSLGLHVTLQDSLPTQGVCMVYSL